MSSTVRLLTTEEITNRVNANTVDRTTVRSILNGWISPSPHDRAITAFVSMDVVTNPTRLMLEIDNNRERYATSVEDKRNLRLAYRWVENNYYVDHD